MLAPIEDPIMADFVNNLDKINNLAEQSPGFVWRLKGEEDNATAIRVFEDEMLIINMSVWKTMDNLFQFTYKSDHVEIFSRRKEWFTRVKEMHMAFWYVPIHHIPTSEEAKQRLSYINKYGETPYAFTFKNKFTIDDFLNYCNQKG